MKPLIPLCLAMFALTACETATLYQPAVNANSVGFSETRIEPGRYRVNFQGGGGASEGQINDYVLLRAAELTIRDGYDWFRVTGRDGQQSAPRSASSISLGGGGGSFGGGGGFGLGLGTSIPLGGSGPRISRSLEILAGHGQAPSGPEVYNARGILDTIGPRAPHPSAAHG